MIAAVQTYLGDAVYAQIDQFGRLVLTTNNGIEDTNTIVLEGDVLKALDQFRIEHFGAEYATNLTT